MAAADHRDADTWGVHLLDAAQQGLQPDYTIADAGQGLRAGQKAAWGDTPCHGDVFHIIRQCEGLANTLSRLAKGATSRREKLEARIAAPAQPGPEDALVTNWRWHDKPKPKHVAGPRHPNAHPMAEPRRSGAGRTGPGHAAGCCSTSSPMNWRAGAGGCRRIRPVRVALRNQRDDLLAFAGVLDKKLAAIARTLEISASLVREACVLHRLPSTSTAYWQGWNRLRAKIGDKFHALLRRGEPGHGADPAQQFAGGEPQLAAAYLLHPAPPPGQVVSGLCCGSS